jgi:DNA-binding beta-propeller fold protein YncE
LRVAALPDPDFHPEGVAWDPRTQRLLVGSVRRGAVIAIDANGAVSPFIASGTSGLRAVFGVLADTARNLLWVSSTDMREREGGTATPRAPASVFAFSLETGRLVRRWGFAGDDPAHLIGELVLAPDGTVWGTDSEQPALYRVPADSSQTVLEKLPLTHPAWRSPQGLAFSADGREAWLADWSTGLYHLDLLTGVVTAVTAPPGTNVRGIDGLYRVGAGHFLAIQNGAAPFRIVALDLDARGTTLRALRVVDHPPGAGEPTLGVRSEEGLYFVGGSLWPFYDAAGQLRPQRGRPLGEIRLLPWR